LLSVLPELLVRLVLQERLAVLTPWLSARWAPAAELVLLGLPERLAPGTSVPGQQAAVGLPALAP
jgi:hypothetical protein